LWRDVAFDNAERWNLKAFPGFGRATVEYTQYGHCLLPEPWDIQHFSGISEFVADILYDNSSSTSKHRVKVLLISVIKIFQAAILYFS